MLRLNRLHRSGSMQARAFFWRHMRFPVRVPIKQPETREVDKAAPVNANSLAIRLRGYRAGYLTIASLMVIGLGMLWFHTQFGHLALDSRMMGLHFLSVFFGMLVIADMMKTVAQVVAYRRAL